LKTIGVVLAGGLSTRMLTDKSQLLWQGKILLEHTSKLLSDAGCDQVVISSNAPSYINDRYPDAGPLAGIEACLNYVSSNIKSAETMLIMPVDMPVMTIELLKNLLQQAKPDNAVFYSLGRFPLILPVNDKLNELLTDTLKQHQSGSGVSVRQLLTKIDCQVLDIDKDQQSAFINCNTPEQWQNLTIN